MSTKPRDLVVQAMADLERHAQAARESWRPVARRSELARAREAGDRFLKALEQLSQFHTN